MLRASQTVVLSYDGLDVERFVYSSEKIDTGVADIDAIEDARSTDMFNYELQLEDASGSLLLENGFKIIKEDYTLSTTTNATTIGASIEPISRNDDFSLNAEDIIDFSTSNPFGEVQR